MKAAYAFKLPLWITSTVLVTTISAPSTPAAPLETKLTAADLAPSKLFGFTVSTGGNTAVVGAPFDDHAGAASGSVYVFQLRKSTV